MRRKHFIFALVAMLLSFVHPAFAQVAKVGDTKYSTIDDAIAAWTNGTTLTLLSDVTLSDVVTLKSTEHHILNLGIYTMTAAEGKNAFVIKACGTGSAEQYAITINADATNPGGINAGSKCVVYYKYADGGISTEDRPIIKINGGVFTGSTSSWGTAGIYTIGTAARKCATLNISGGTFNCSINGSGKSKLIISGGVFNYSVGSQGDSTASRLISGGTFKSFGFMTADSNNTKFWIGTSMGNSNVGVHVDDNGYIVVGGPVVTEAGESFEASSANYSGASSYLQYSSAVNNGLYYTSVEEAFADNNKASGSVTVYVDELDMTDISYKGTIVVPADSKLTITNPPATLVVKDEEGNVLEANANGTFTTVAPKGNDFTGYTGGDAIWGEVWGNATESFVIKVLDANGNVMGTTSLNNVNGIIDGDVNVTWSLKLDAASNTDEYWTMAWTTAPTIDNMPAKVELWVDGVKVSGGNVVLNGPDEIAKIYAAVTDASGKILGYHTDIQEAIKAAAAVTSVAKTATAGTVEVLSDVTVDKWVMFAEKMSIGDGSLITLNINGVTIDGNGKTLTVKSIESASNGGYLFYDAQNLTVKDLTINIADGLVGGIGLQSGTISNVTFNGGQYAVLPGKNGVTIDGCTFNDTKGYAIYYEDARPGIVVDGNTFNTAEGKYAITMRSDEQFTNNTITKGRVNLANSAASTVSGNDFGEERFKVYNGATATISNNKINNLVFNETTAPAASTFTADNTLSAEAQAAIEALPVMAGDGTEANPYTISNLTQLKAFRDDVNAGNNYQGKFVKLTADIDLNNEEWTPIAYNGKTFKGTFDGGNKTIKNLKITKTLTNSAENNGIGLFGRTDDPATIKNFTIENVDITGSLYVGAAVGHGYTGKLVENVTVKGNIAIDAWWYAGVIGGNGYMNTINNCHVIGNDGSYIKGNDGSYIGGIWGFRGEGANKITNCTVTNLDIQGVDRVGGISGIGHYGNSIEGCSVNSVNVTATDADATTVGIIIGACQGTEGEPTKFADNTVQTVTVKIGDAVVENPGLYGTNINGGNAVTNYVAKIGNVYYESLAEAVSAAQSGATITLMNGEHELPLFAGKELTFVGESKEGVIVNDAPAAVTQGWNGSTFHFENLTAKGATENYHGLANGVKSVTYKDCNINGLRFLYATEGVSFEGCAFNANGVEHSFWTYGASNVTVKNSTFTYTDRAVNCYSENGANHEADIAFEGCSFTYAGTNDNPEGAVEINSGSAKSFDIAFTDCTAPEKGAMWFNSQWDNKNGENTVVKVNGEIVWQVVKVAKIGDVEYTSLQNALDAAAAGTGNVTVTILADVNLTGVDWNPVTVSAPGYPLVTVEGNGKTITGLNDMLFAGTWAGKSGLIIKNLTIENSAIVNDKDDAKGTVGVGAFIGYPQASATITLENCHLKNSSVEGGHWTGGLIGMAGGYNGNDGPVFMNLTIKGCSVTGSTITGKGSVGGVIGHGSCAAWTNVVIEETTVSNNTITSTGSSNVKAGAVMGTIGAAGQPTTVNGVTNTGGMSVSATVAENTVKSNGTEITTIYGRQGTETGMLYVAGGSYDNYPIEEGVAYAAPAKGYKIEQNTDGTYGVVVDPAYGKVAKIGDVYYATIQEAVVAAQTGDTVTLVSDIAMTEADCVAGASHKVLVDVVGKDITLDMNGKKISVNHMDEFTNTAECIVSVIRVENGAGLTVTGNGTIDVNVKEGNPDIVYMFWKRGTTGHLTIENGTFHMNDAYDSMVYTNGNEIVFVKGGSWTLDSYGTRGNREPWIFNVQGAGDNHVVVTGGTYNADINRQHWSNEVVVPETHYTVANADSTAFTVNEGAVAYVNEGMLTGPYFIRKNIGYATLAEAIAEVDTDETVTLLQDVTLDDALVIEEGMDVTVNGVGKTITGCDGKDVFYVKGGKLTLTEGLNVHATTDCAIYLRGGDVFTAANLTKSGNKYSVIQGNGNYAGNVTITGGKVEASDNLTAIYWPQNGKLTITGGEITGHSAVYIASGSLEITGGKLHGVGANGSYEGVTGGSANAPGEALTIENVGGNSGYEEISSVVISGGEFISDNAKAVGSYANTTQNPEAKPVAGFISGGTFSSALEASYCAEGFGPYAYGDGTFGVESLNVDDITIVDGAEDEFVNQNEKTVGTLTYKRSNVKTTWTPFYVPFAVPVSALADKFDVAYINAVRRRDGNSDGVLDDDFTMEIIFIHCESKGVDGSGKILKPNYPYFIRSKSGVAEMEITLTDATLYAAKENVYDCTTMTEKFEIKGNYHQIPSDDFDENDYVVGGGVWGNITAGYPLNPFRFYMTRSSRDGSDPTTMAPMKSMKIVVCGEEDENGATIIYDVVEDSLNNNGDDYIYDLQGRRVSEPKKGGIYIKNGKKILY